MKVFNNSKVLPLGWYWALPSKELPPLGKRELRVFGEKLVLYRGKSGKVYCLEAHCPHMGAHLKEGKVIGEALQCAFHGWKFGGQGECVDIPCKSRGIHPTSIPRRRSPLVAEKYSMIWIHSDPQATLETHPLPSFPDLEGFEVTSVTDMVETRECHPSLILGGGVDEEHFLFTHSGTTKVTGPLEFRHTLASAGVIRFENSAPMKAPGLQGRLLSRLYGGVLKYAVTYWNGSTAFAELGFPFFPLYSIFAYRPTPEGKTEGLNIYITRRRKGPVGFLLSRLAIRMTRSILRKGGGEDRVIQNSIQFVASPYAFGNPPFRAFVDYMESLPVRPLKICAAREEEAVP